MQNLVDFSKLAKELKAYTAINNTTEAYIVLAEALINEEVKEKLIAIQKEQDRVGYLSHELNAKRYLLFKELMKEVQRFGEDNYKLINSSL